MNEIVEFVRDRETRGAWIYREVDGHGNVLEIYNSIVGSLYIRKSALNGRPAPEKLTVEIRTNID